MRCFGTRWFWTSFVDARASPSPQIRIELAEYGWRRSGLTCDSGVRSALRNDRRAKARMPATRSLISDAPRMQAIDRASFSAAEAQDGPQPRSACATND